jgi:hypothetical protein
MQLNAEIILKFSRRKTDLKENGRELEQHRIKGK